MPESLDAALRDVGAVFLVWTVPLASAPAVVERLAARARRVVFLSSPHQTPHPFFQHPNPMAVLHADIERLIGATGSNRRSSGRGYSRRTRCSGGRPRFAPTVLSGGPTGPPRRHPSMTATWQLSRRGPCTRRGVMKFYG